MKAYLDTKTGAVFYPPFASLPESETPLGTNLNSQLYYLESGENFIAYAPYNYFAALISKQEYLYLMSHPTKGADIPSNLEKLPFYVNIDEVLEHENKSFFAPTDLTIFLGDVCNLGCVYCNAISYRKDGNFSPQKTIEGFKVVADKTKITSVSFFGNGEPLIYFDTIKDIVQLAKEKGITEFSVTTNGVLGNRITEIVKFLVENNFQAQISIDGNETIHNLHRPTLGGKGSFGGILKTIQEFSKYGDINNYCSSRFTLTKYSSKHLKEILTFLNQLGFKKIRFAELIPEGGAIIPINELTTVPNSLEIVDDMVQAFLLAESLGIDFAGDYDSREPANTGAHGCVYMAGTAFSINQNLDVLCCLEDNPAWAIGKVNLETSNLSLHRRKLRTIQARNMLNMEECASCPVKCGGGCTHYSFVKNGNLKTTGDYPEKCQALQQILEKYLRAKLEM